LPQAPLHLARDNKPKRQASPDAAPLRSHAKGRFQPRRSEHPKSSEWIRRPIRRACVRIRREHRVSTTGPAAARPAVVSARTKARTVCARSRVAAVTAYHPAFSVSSGADVAPRGTALSASDATSSGDEPLVRQDPAQALAGW
jgi:hypothetical protein